MVSGLAGKTVLVTGGSQGIGKAIAVAFAREGANVGICARGREGLERAAAELRGAGSGKVATAVADCTVLGDVRRMVVEITQEIGPIDILVSCVGRAKAGPFTTLTDEDWLDAINLKLLGAVRVAREVVPQMIAKKRGRIIVIGGVFGSQPSPFAMPMGAVNAALFNFTKALAQEAVKHNILVNAVSPGRVETPLFRQLVQRHADELRMSSEQARAEILKEVPIGRPAEPAEIANVVLFLASDLASYISGEIITVDGSWSRGL